MDKSNIISNIVEESKEENNQLELNGITILLREDGYINATQLCKSGNKKFSHWFSLQGTKVLINILSSKTGISISNLLDIKKGVNDKKTQGSWFHPDLAVQLAQWISPTFALEVSSWISEWRKISEINNNRFLESLNNIEDESSKNNKEKRIHLFDIDDNIQIDIISKLYNKYNIILTIE